MSNAHNTHDDHFSYAHMVEECWPAMLFGGFFLMTMLLPLLTIPDLRWAFWLAVGIIVSSTVILLLPVLKKNCCK